MTEAEVKALLREFEQLAARAGEFEAELDGVRRLAERRRQLEAQVWGRAGSPEYREWEDSRERVDGFYAEFGRLVDAARGRLEDLRAVVGTAETERIDRALHAAAVRSTREALERAVALIGEDAEARKEQRRQRRRAAMQSGWIPEAGKREPQEVSPAVSTKARRTRDAQPEDGSAALGRVRRERALERPPWQPESWSRDAEGKPGRWVTAKEFSCITGIPTGTLANWRHQDRKAGREEPLPGKPRYQHFGLVVRYWLPRSLEHPYGPTEEGERRELE